MTEKDMKKYAEATEKYPQIKKLIIKACDVAAAKKKLSEISSLSHAYNELLKH